MPVPNPGDIIFNEYASDNDANGNDFVELLTIADNLDLRGLRISDNELIGGVLNNNESVFVFGNDAFLNNVPKGTAIAIWTAATGITPDTITNPANNDWKMALAPGTGITASVDGLGGNLNTGLSTGGEALYLYSPGADGNSGGTDNVYLDFLSFENDGGDAPTGLTDINLASVADNAYYTGNTATGKNTASNWVRYDFPSTNPTPGDANLGQDLSGLRAIAPVGIAIAQSDGSTNVSEAGVTDGYTLVLNSQPTADVTVTVSSDSQTTTNPTTLIFTSANWNQPQTVTVTAVDDTTFEGNHSSSITHTVSSSDGNYNGIAVAGVNVNISDNDIAPASRIRDIQGTAHRSPLVGQTVNNVQGVVTAIAARGFYLQDPNPDSNDGTSEGIFVFTSSAPSVTVGQSVEVTGRVDEFRPGNNAGNLTTTQINASVSGAVVTPLASSLGTITPIVIGTGGRVPPNAVIQNDFTTTNRGNVETGGDFDPTTEGIDFYESLEGMLVQINNPVTISPTNNFGEIWVLPDNGANATGRTARGGSLISPTDFNPERIQIDDTLFTSGTSPLVNVGATLNTISGVVDYNFNNYEVLPTSLTVNSPGSLTKEITNLAGDSDNLTVATFNVENLDPGDGDTQFNNIANRIVNNLKAPDIISLEEIQDNNGATNDTVVDANQTYQKLIDAIKTAGGPTYQYRQINPVDDQDGGEPGGNIRVGFLFNPARVSFVDRPGGGSTINTTITNASGKPELSANPGRIDPTNSAFSSSRKPLVGEFIFKGETVFAIANHFNSKGGDQSLFGPNQPPILTSETQRLQQAQIINDFVDSILAVDPNSNVIVLGDLNDFEFSEPLNVIKGIPGGTGTPVLNNLLDTIGSNERYTYNFQGNAQVLDHILVSNNLSQKLNGYDIVHINSEFADQDSDHDPSVAKFNFAPQPKVTNYNFTNLPKLGTTSTGEDIFLGGFSGLYFQGIAANGNLKFVTHTDRGPNGEPTAGKRPFLLPNFQPEVVSFELNRSTNEITITKRTGLFRQDGTTPLTGLPNLQIGGQNTAYTDEIGVDLKGNTLNNDTLGADLEGIVVAENGDLWMVDEYRPAIYHFNSNGKLIDRFIPQGDVTDSNKNGGTNFGTPIIPAVYAQRRANRGFEAVALEGRKLYAFIQSAIDNPDNASDTVSRASRNLRILEFDIQSKQVTGEYLYLLDDITASGNAKTDKIGDAVALGNGKFAVVERDDLSTTASNKLIYQIDLAEATNIHNPANFTLPANKTIEQLTPQELTTANIKPVSKSLIANAAKFGYTGVEKLEGLALVAPNTLALVNDNDFNVAGTTTPEQLGILELPNNLPVAQAGLTKNSSNDVFNISGGVGIPRLEVSLVGRNSNLVNELGVFTVDDRQGTINGIAPGQTGYTEAALERSKVILSAIANNPNGFNPNQLTRLLEFNSGDNIRFLLVKDSSLDTVKAGKTPLSNVLISSQNTQNITDTGNGSFTLSWEDGTGNSSDFKDLEVKIQVSNQTLPLGSNLQGANQAELLDLRGISGSLKAEFTLNREAGFDNLVGFYKIANENGGIDTNNDEIADILPGQSGYIQAAINQRIPGVDLTVNNQGTATLNSNLLAGSLLAPFIIANGKPDAILDSNSNNDPAVYFSFLGANPGQVDHIRLLGNNTWGFEDLPLGGDKDYNDVIVRVNLTV